MFRLPVPVWLVLILLIQISATVLTTLSDANATRTAALLPAGSPMLARFSLVQDLGASLGPLLAYLISPVLLFPAAAILLASLAAS